MIAGVGPARDATPVALGQSLSVVYPESPAMPSFRNLISGSLLSLVAALALLTGGAHARQTFLIPQSDGYGIGDCFVDGRDCARVVADAWCEAHGNAHAIAYGRADDATASIGELTASDAALASGRAETLAGSIIISCGD